MTFREFHYRWSVDLKSSPESLWPFIADTNRFNRDTGLPSIVVDDDKKPLRNARRKVRLSIFGMDVEWEEQPFEWVVPVRFGIERIYSKGPMARMRALAELTPKEDGGTRVTYEIRATPKNLIGMVAIPTQLKLKTGPRVRATFQRYDELASVGVDAGLSEASTLPEADRSRLAALGEKLFAETDRSEEARQVVDRLVSLIETADDFGVARIRPYQFADCWKVSRRLVLEVCLRATRVGMLDLRWDLLCPMCRGAKDTGSSLKNIPSEVHCPSCKIDFTSDFDKYVELTFKPNPAIRRVEVQDFCVGSPERTPHIVVQQLIPAGNERALELPLGSGNYRVRALELQGSQSLSVSANGESSATIVISKEGWNQQELSISKRTSLTLKNETDSEQLLILERMAWSDQAATAAEVTALQIFRDLFSTEALRPGEHISVGTQTVLFTDLRHSTRLYREIGDATAFGRVMNHFDVLKKVIAEHDGAIVKTIGDAVMAVFRCPANALVAMLDAQSALANPGEGAMPLQLKAGLHSGPCIAVTLNDRLDYFGSTVNMAARLEGLSSGSEVIISRTVFEDSKVIELLKSEMYEALPFEMTLKGFEEEQAELWRVRRIEEASVKGQDQGPRTKDQSAI
jgi:class 3 adenylate cyclase